MAILDVIVAVVIIVYDRLAICYVSIICYYYKNIIPIKLKKNYALLVPTLVCVPTRTPVYRYIQRSYRCARILVIDVWTVEPILYYNL